MIKEYSVNQRKSWAPWFKYITICDAIHARQTEIHESMAQMQSVLMMESNEYQQQKAN